MKNFTPCFSITLLSACDGVKTFPPGFMFGAASASYHGDGAWEAEGDLYDFSLNKTHCDLILMFFFTFTSR